MSDLSVTTRIVFKDEKDRIYISAYKGLLDFEIGHCLRVGGNEDREISSGDYFLSEIHQDKLGLSPEDLKDIMIRQYVFTKKG